MQCEERGGRSCCATILRFEEGLVREHLEKPLMLYKKEADSFENLLALWKRSSALQKEQTAGM